MFNKIGNKLKAKFDLIKKKAINRWTVIKVGVMTTICTLLPSMSAYAANDYTKSLVNARTVALTIVAAIGGLVFVYGIVSFAESFDKGEQGGMYSAAKKIAAGAILVSGDMILNVILG